MKLYLAARPCFFGSQAMFFAMFRFGRFDRFACFDRFVSAVSFRCFGFVRFWCAAIYG